MTELLRSHRGRLSKVTKPASNASRRPSSRPHQALEQALHPALQSDGGDVRLSDGTPNPIDDGLADADAEAEGELDDTAAQQDHSHVENLALSAAGILANGGNIMPPDDGTVSEYPGAALMAPDYDGARATTEGVARESGYASIVVESALAKRLAREPGLRTARQRRPEQVLNITRRSNVEALFAHIAGEEVSSPCKNCHKGHGPWTSCVVIDGQMCGSCANCWFNASGARCSFHDTRNPQAQPLHHQQHHLGGVPVAVGGAVPDANSYAAQPRWSMHGAPNLSIGDVDLGAALSLNDPTVAYTIERAFADVRAADKNTRQLMLIEIQAKQLALSILSRAEDRVQDDPPGAPSQVLGDEEAS